MIFFFKKRRKIFFIRLDCEIVINNYGRRGCEGNKARVKREVFLHTFFFFFFFFFSLSSKKGKEKRGEKKKMNITLLFTNPTVG